jgi:tetratricopeptide (TPR) repeat protein
MATADPAEAVILRRRVEELERQIADPDPALAAALAEIANLKARLEREANQIGADRVNNFVGVVEDQVRFVEAEEFFRKALEIGRRTIGEEHTDYAIRLNNLAMVVQAQGRFAEAEGLYRQALEIDRATIGAGHPDYATRLNNLAGAVRLQGRYAEAEGLYREALEIGRRTIG